MAQNGNGNKKDTGGNTGAVIGMASVAAAVAAAAGAYWLYGATDAKKNRARVKSFMLKSRADVMDAVEKLRDIDKTTYMGIVDKVVAKYSTVAGITAQEVAQMTRDLKSAWLHMKAVHDTATAKSNAGAKSAKKVAPKKAAKKAVSK